MQRLLQKKTGGNLKFRQENVRRRYIVFRLRSRYFIRFAFDIVKEVTTSMQPAIYSYSSVLCVSNRQQAMHVCRHSPPNVVCVCVCA